MSSPSKALGGAGGAAPANPAPLTGALHDWTARHSELFQEQVKGDPTATVEGCLPPEVTMPWSRAVGCLDTLRDLHAELHNGDGLRIRRVREGLFASLAGKTPEDLADMKVVADYLCLPKALIAAMDQHDAANRAKAAYTEAMGGYSLTTSFEEKPRICDYLAKAESLKPLLQEAVRTVSRLEVVLGTTQTVSQFPVVLSISKGTTAPILGNIDNGSLPAPLMDGILGDPLSEYGHLPSESRVSMYSAGCVLAGRPLPLASLPKETPEHFKMFYHDHPVVAEQWKALCNPRDTAAAMGKVDVLVQLQGHGWLNKERPDSPCWHSSARTAASFGQQGVLEWCAGQVSLHWRKGGTHPVLAFRAATQNAQFELAKWLLDAYELREVLRGEGRLQTLTKATEAAAKSNDLDAFRWTYALLGAAGDSYHSHAIAFACGHNNKDMIELAVGAGARVTGAELVAAMELGRSDLYQYLLGHERLVGVRRQTPPGKSLWSAACKGLKGDEAVLSSLLRDGEILDEYGVLHLLGAAAKRGLVHTFEWLRRQAGFEDWAKNYTNRHFMRTLGFAVLYEHPEAVLWLVQQAEASLVHAASSAARRPTLYMQSVILPETPKAGKISMSTLATLAKYFDLGDMYYVAISRRDTDVARWLSARGFRVPRTDYDGLLSGLLNAGEQGLPMVRCLVEECGLVMGSYEPRNANYRRDYRRYLDASTAAACSGSVKMMEFVLMQGCAASNDALTYAAERGHLPLLRWLRGRFPYWPWPAGIVAQARTNGMAEVATWLVESGAPGDDDDDDDYGDDDEDDFGDDDDDDFGDDDDDDDE